MGPHNKRLYGVATVGTKGQVVIPADAREEFSINPGDRLYVIGSKERGFVGFLKEDQLEALVDHLSEHVETLRSFKDTNQPS